jgi:hypothetical protein
MELEIIIRIILDILILLLGLFYLLSKSYFTEKGKNIATKEDIGIITKEIEIVKNSLLFNNQRNRDWYVESKNNLINCYDSYFKWIDCFNVADIVLNYHDNINSLRETINNLKNNNRELQKHLWRLSIYDKDLEFSKSVASIYTKTIAKHNQVLHLLLSLEDITVQHGKLIETAEINTENREEILSKYEDLKKAKRKIFSDFERNTVELNEVVKEGKVQFVKLFRNKINMDFAYVEETNI